MPKRVKDLEINQDLRFEHNQWRVERASRVAVGLLLLAALLGLFGPGPVSWSDAEDGALTASYERFTRRGGTSSLEVRVGAEAADAGTFEVLIERDYMAGFTVDSITPTPDSVAVEGRWLVYSFTTENPSQGLVAEFSLTPEGLWSVGGQMALPSGETVTVRHFVYP